MLIFFSFDLFSVTLFSAKISTKFSHFSRQLHASFWFHAREIPKTYPRDTERGLYGPGPAGNVYYLIHLNTKVHTFQRIFSMIKF